MSRQDGRVKASIRSQVLNALAEAHADEFHEAMLAAYAEHDLLYVIPETPEQRARRKREATLARKRAEFDALLTEFPELAQALPQGAMDPSDPEPVVDLGLDPELARG